MGYNVVLDQFEGPMDLLLHLIDANQIDIYDIPVAEVTEQYLEYLNAMQACDLEVTSEFLVMAATLLQIKSRMLLPKPLKPLPTEQLTEDAGSDPREELVGMLLEYRRYKLAAQALEACGQRRQQVYTRLPLEVTTTDDVFLPEGMTLDDLIKAFAALYHRAKQNVSTVEREEVTIQEKMSYIIHQLEQFEKCTFVQLLVSRTKSDVVITFLAVLELVKLSKIAVRQNQLFGEIVVQGLIADCLEMRG